MKIAITKNKMGSTMKPAHKQFDTWERAKSVFGSADMAKAWMIQNNLVLGCSPMAMLDKENGKEYVLKVLASIEYSGVV